MEHHCVKCNEKNVYAEGILCDKCLYKVTHER
jgi:hypothetical protein